MTARAYPVLRAEAEGERPTQMFGRDFSGGWSSSVVFLSVLGLSICAYIGEQAGRAIGLAGDF